MINSFMGMEITTRGLLVQQLEQNITADNLAKTYQDSNGYLMTSLQQLNLTEGTPLVFGNLGNSNGLLAIGTGPLGQQITRLRSSFLDGQIQSESTILGQAEIMTNTLSQINGIINPSTGTLDSALTTFATAWANLAATPLNVGLRANVVNTGLAFATLANNQYTQLQTLQTGMNNQITQTVSDINQILQQLSSLNTQLLGSQGANVNDLLDARDYAITRLSRLINIQTSFGADGTASVYLGGLALVDSAGAAILQTDVLNPHNPGLVDVTVQSPEGTRTLQDATPIIQGGNLGGELRARDILLESYKTQIDQIATSVMNVTNIFHQSGYAADGVTTGTIFFTGTGAKDIGVNASIVANPSALLAASSRLGVPTNGQIAQFLGNLPNLLANNFIESQTAVNSGAPVDPTQTLLTETPNFATPPAGGGNFTVNGSPVAWTTADTVYTLLDKINAADPTVQAVFNTTTQKFYMLSANPINIVDTPFGPGSFTNFGNIANVLVSTIRMNNGFAPTDPKIIYGFPLPANSGLNSAPNGAIPLPNSTGNFQAFRVTPGLGGSFNLDGVAIPWFNNGANNTSAINQNLRQIVAAINAGVYPGTTINAVFNTATETLTLFSALNPKPIQIIDTVGNFTVFTGLNGDVPVGSFSSSILNQINSQLSAQQLVQNQASASLTQLNTEQANIGAVSTSAGQPGVPIQVIQQNAVQSLIAFNAQLQVLQIIDQMYADLVSIIGPATSTTTFQQRL